MFTVKLTGDFTGYTVSGYAIDQYGNIVQVGFYTAIAKATGETK